MRQQVADGHFVRNVRIVHLETGEPFVNAVVPRKFSVINEGGERGGSECLGVGADTKQSVFIHERGLTHFANAVAFCQNHLSVFDNANRKTRNVERFEYTRHVSIEIGRRRALPKSARHAKQNPCHQQEKLHAEHWHSFFANSFRRLWRGLNQKVHIRAANYLLFHQRRYAILPVGNQNDGDTATMKQKTDVLQG